MMGRIRIHLINLIPFLSHGLAALVPYLWWSILEERRLSAALVVAAFFIGNLPDIDTGYSHIGRVFHRLSRTIESRWGHRTITHSLPAVA